MLEELIEEYKDALLKVNKDRDDYNKAINYFSEMSSSIETFRIGEKKGELSSQAATLRIVIRDLEKLKTELKKEVD